MEDNQILNKLNIEPFSPPRSLAHPLAQTIVPYYLPQWEITRKGLSHTIALPDQDQLAITELCPVEWQKGDRIVVLIHGLAGSENSPYIKRLSEKFFQQNFLVVKVNLRSCGPGRGLALHPYHCGRSEDARAVLLWLQERYPKSPITQIGFSLSANITLKMLGESLVEDIEQLDSCVAVSPPLDLMKTSHKITKLSFGLFDKFFLYKLKKNVSELKEDFPGKIDIQFPKKMNMIDFDNLYTAPRSGFEDAQDYYNKASSQNFVPHIKTPTLILHSVDDPVVASEGMMNLDIPTDVDVVETQRGGHVGFLGRNGFWMDELLLNWVKSRRH